MNPPVNYVIDDDTQELLETVLNWAQTVVDLQQDEDAKDDMQIELEELALRFNIQRSQVDIEETTDADGATTITVRLADPTNTRPKLTVVPSTTPTVSVPANNNTRQSLTVVQPVNDEVDKVTEDDPTSS